MVIGYHTSHIVSETGKMVLHEGGHMNSIIGLLHDKPNRFEIEPMVIGQPWFDHPRNGEDSSPLMWCGHDFGEILPEDIEQFSRMRDVNIEAADEWKEAMKKWSEVKVKEAFAHLLSEDPKKDWGGESDDHFSDDHFSGSVEVNGRRRTAAFLLKGPTHFREMTLEMCGKRAGQIHRIVDTGSDISVIQHAHQIGAVVRRTLRALAIQPGDKRRKYCLIDGQATYRILKAYSLL